MYKRINFLIVAFLTFIILVAICHYLFRPIFINTVENLHEGWTISFDEELYEDVDLDYIPKYIEVPTDKGDIITMSRTLPKSSVYTFPTLLFLSRYSAFEVYADNELISSGFLDLMEKDSFIGSSYNFVTIPQKDSDISLKIVLYPTDKSSYTYFLPPIYGEYHDVERAHLFRNLFPLATGIFLIIFGAAFCIITLSFYKTLPSVISQLFSSLLFIVLGIWILCYFRLIDFFVYTNSKSSVLEFISLYLMIPLTYTIIGCIQDHYKDWIFLVVAGTSTTICLFLAILHFADILHMNRTLHYFQSISVMCALFLAVTFYKDLKQKKLVPAEIIQMIGLMFFAMSCIVNFIAFSLEVMHIIPQSLLTVRLIPMGGLIFVFANLINYFIYISESFAMRKEYASLTHLAYADGLTDLPNRSRYDKYMSDLDEGTEEYCVVSLDLNGLKEINDKDGHAAGDKYLTEFASVLRQCFDQKAFIARIGGDEFVAILKEDHFSEVETLLTRLKDALEVKNVLYPAYRRSVASGFAYSTEINKRDSHSVYLLADKRMYESKKIMHAKLGIAPRI
ncbi:GGDEF domain-containing protein [Butyrivibrio sp. AC2005]|uniref:GGDEF domain-containing protein n=1 Tax=Butyrivibrio sp. AC2005 TaxID=1280672 RepID=UPI000403CFEB|nr:diguanylate cyclase [Butyrivibrio sp. AC2005]